MSQEPQTGAICADLWLFFVFKQTPAQAANFDRPDVAKLRGHSGRDPREKSEVAKGTE